MKYRITRTVVTVQYAIVEAEDKFAARDLAVDDPQLIEWRESSQNDPEITDIEKVED
jgi:hypothetical protein